MRRTKIPKRVLMANSALTQRLQYAGLLGQTYGGDRDLYQALGYKQSVNYKNFVSVWSRQDMAQAIINRPVNKTWSGPLRLSEASDKEDTQLEKAWIKLEKDLKLKSKFSRVDKLTGLGHYGVLFLGFSDVKEREGFKLPVEGSVKLMYVKPLGEDSAMISTYDKDPSSSRYGLPLFYTIKTSSPGGGGDTSELQVHYSRVIHIVEGELESETHGTPRLEVVYNRLEDLEKVVGGSGEMFWRGARPGFAANVDPEYTMGPEEEADLMNQVDEYENNLRRILTLQGVDMKALETQVSDPKSQVDVIMQLICAVTSIPKRVLTGSERGELSSSQDADEWASYIQNRRNESAEPNIVRPFVDRMIEYGVLPKQKLEEEGYGVKWSDLFAQSEKEKVEIGKARATALKDYSANPEASMILPPDAFFEFLMGFEEDQIELVTKMREAYQQEVEKQEERNAEEEEIMRQNAEKEEVDLPEDA